MISGPRIDQGLLALSVAQAHRCAGGDRLLVHGSRFVPASGYKIGTIVTLHDTKAMTVSELRHKSRHGFAGVILVIVVSPALSERESSQSPKPEWAAVATA